MHVSAVPADARRGCWLSWSWSCRLLWVTWGCWVLCRNSTSSYLLSSLPSPLSITEVLCHYSLRGASSGGLSYWSLSHVFIDHLYYLHELSGSFLIVKNRFVLLLVVDLYPLIIRKLIQECLASFSCWCNKTPWQKQLNGKVLFSFRVDIIRAGKSKQQHLHAGHMVPTTSKQRRTKAGQPSSLSSRHSPGSQQENGATHNRWVFPIEITPHTHAQGPISRVNLNSVQQTILWTIVIHRGFCY